MYRYKRTDSRVYLHYKDADTGCTLTAEAGGVYNIVPVTEDLPPVPGDFEEVVPPEDDKPVAKKTPEPVVAEAPAVTPTESDGE